MPNLSLVLQDGTTLTGQSFGAEIKNEAYGEVVFNTGMVGYPESFTDPSYEGQILILTYPLIGNYGVPDTKAKDKNNLLKFFESDKIHIRGLIVSEYSENHSHHEAKKSLADWLKENGIPAIQGIDTRALTQKLRTHGVMLGKITASANQTTTPKATPTTTKTFLDPNNTNLVAEVSIKEPILYKSKSTNAKKIIAIDCGMKNNILRNLLARNLTVLRTPWNYDFIATNEINNIDGIFLSNGPGDPATLTKLHEIIRKAMKTKTTKGKPLPIFGICLGNQILAIAAGAKTYKLPFGHRAQNQPVIDIDPASQHYNHCYITSQNHGYAIDEKTLPNHWIPWLKNLNDNSNEGIRHTQLPFFSCQFHPEATPGPTDTQHFFDQFTALL